MKLEFIGKKEKVADGCRFVRRDYSIGGYAVAVIDTIYSDGSSRREVDCRALERGSYLPEIYYRGGWLHGEPAGFEIQTTTYGALGMGEFKKFLEAQQAALEVVEALNREFNGAEA